MSDLEVKMALVNVVNAWEALPGGRRYTPWEIEQWMSEKMKPAMDRARMALGRPIPTGD